VAYVLLATVVAAAALQASVVYRDFCRQAGAGVASAVAAGLAAALLAFLSASNLFRLYGSKS
jgi:hypothetical protein